MKRNNTTSPSKIVHIQGVGDVQLQRSRRAKHICLSVRPFKGVRIAVPWHVSYQEAMEVVQDKADWLIKHLQRVAHIEKAADAFHRQAPINRAVARNIIVDRLNELARRHGFTYNKVFVRNQKTRWGSCSSCNNISLNVNLIRLPAELLDYTILHELVHTRIKDHSPWFWEELAKYVSQPRKVDKQLNRFGPMLLYPRE
ncbi:MAG: M48 family metallopeptidase [Desulfobacteraceae bacterium]|jgi:predicted metal-dependent hydrolase